MHIIFTYNFLKGSNGYKSGFNGKENIDEIDGWQDYGMRMYNRLIGRFPTADPLIVYQQQYSWYSPYQFAGNKPIVAIDLDGLEELIVILWYNNRNELVGSTQFRVPRDLRAPDRQTGVQTVKMPFEVVNVSASTRSNFETRLGVRANSEGRRNFLRSNINTENGYFFTNFENNYTTNFTNFHKGLNSLITKLEESRAPQDGDFTRYWINEYSINFNFANNTDPLKISEEIIKQIVFELQQNPNYIARVTAFASNDDINNPTMSNEEKTAYNDNLAKERANNIKKAIIEKGGNALSERIQIDESNSTEREGENKASNRSGTVIITNLR